MLMDLEMRWQPFAAGWRKLLSVARHSDGSILRKWVRNGTGVDSWFRGGLLGWGWGGRARYPKFVRGGDFSEGHLHVLIDLQPAVSS